VMTKAQMALWARWAKTYSFSLRQVQYWLLLRYGTTIKEGQY
jgi:hypothetical protein